jgi:hypothetical protein
MNPNQYNHPSEGLSLPVRFLIAVAAIGFFALVCSAAPADSQPVRPSRYVPECRLIAQDADHDTGKLDRIAARHGGIDYRGPLAFSDRVGRWTLNDSGEVFGYSLHEDSRIFSSARCAKIRPAYT